jgi:hypothetical protein
MLRLMPFRLPKRSARRGDATVLGTYFYGARTVQVQVLRTSDERIEWTCDCEKFRLQGRCETPLWCKHIAKAAARRSLERLTARRIGLGAAESGSLRGSVPAPRPAGRLPPSKIAPGDFVMPR